MQLRRFLGMILMGSGIFLGAADIFLNGGKLLSQIGWEYVVMQAIAWPLAVVGGMLAGDPMTSQEGQHNAERNAAILACRHAPESKDGVVWCPLRQARFAVVLLPMEMTPLPMSVEDDE